MLPGDNTQGRLLIVGRAIHHAKGCYSPAGPAHATSKNQARSRNQHRFLPSYSISHRFKCHFNSTGMFYDASAVMCCALQTAPTLAVLSRTLRALFTEVLVATTIRLRSVLARRHYSRAKDSTCLRCAYDPMDEIKQLLPSQPSSRRVARHPDRYRALAANHAAPCNTHTNIGSRIT